MDARLQRRIQRYGWNKAVDYYEPYWKQQLAPAQTRLLAMADLHRGEHVLDMACGTGIVTCRAAALVGPEGAVVGTDIAEHMVDTARHRATEQQLRQITLARMDAEDLQCSDGVFDAALCALGLMYVPDPGRALQEMYRVLKPGGRAAVAVWGQRSRCGWAAIFPIVAARVRSDVCPLFFQLGTADILAQTLQTAGFTDKGIPVTVVRHIQELVTGEHAVRVRGEDLQEVELHGGYRYLLALQGEELMGLKVEEALSKALARRSGSAGRVLG